jgi:Zn-dependent protease
VTGLGAFRIAGVPVRIDPTFLVVVLLLGWGARQGALLVAWVVIVTVSVLLHELGHAAAFRRYGQDPQILLQGMGGLTSGSGEPLSPRRDIVVSLAGPLAGLILLGLPALAIARSSENLSTTWETVLSDLVFVNLAWSVVNLLPILPLDGGRVSAALWSLRTGGAGERPAHILSAVVAGGAAVFALSGGYLFGALFAGFFCAYNVSQLSTARNATLQQRLIDGWRTLAADDPRSAAAAAEGVLRDRPSRQVMEQAGELLAWARHAQGDDAEARAAIARLPHGSTANPFLLASLTLSDGKTDEALDHLVAGYAENRFSPAAPAAAEAAARNGLVEPLAYRLLAPDGPGAGAAGILAAHLHAAERFSDAMEVAERALEAGHDDPGRLAYNIACSAARAGQLDVSLDWLDRALALGFADAALLDRDPDLEALRSHERFATARARLAAQPTDTET